MSQLLAIHPDNPQDRLIKQAVEIIKKGGVIVYPTDSCYALGCALGNKTAMERILEIRKIDLKHHLTLMCADLSDLGTYAKVDNSQFRQLKAATLGVTPLFCKQQRKCRTEHCTQNAKRLVCACLITKLHWHCWQN